MMHYVIVRVVIPKGKSVRQTLRSLKKDLGEGWRWKRKLPVEYPLLERKK